MYKCTDCGQEFDTKPEYCDCGNNIFEEIIAEKKVKRAVKFKQTKSNIKFDILSWIIFGLCIILSIFVWIFIGNGEDAAEHSEKPKEHVEIPPINRPASNADTNNFFIHSPFLFHPVNFFLQIYSLNLAFLFLLIQIFATHLPL